MGWIVHRKLCKIQPVKNNFWIRGAMNHYYNNYKTSPFKSSMRPYYTDYHQFN